MSPLFFDMTSRAFTLIEILVVVGFVGLVGAALTTMIRNFYQANTFVIHRSQAVESSRRGIESAMQDFREASYGDDGAYPILSTATSSVTFFADVDADRAVEKVTYYLLGSTLYRGVTNSAGSPPTYLGQPEATSTIATYVANGTSTPIFRYYNASSTELSIPLNTIQVASVVTTIRVDLDPIRAPGIFTLTGSATLRNLRASY